VPTCGDLANREVGQHSEEDVLGDVSLVISQLRAQRCFDVVTFDEASPVTPADAVGASMRAGRAVVAGDPGSC